MSRNKMPIRRRKTMPENHSSERWHGGLDGIHRGLLFGWAVDTQQPESRLVLEVCLNDEVIGCLIADVARTDLADTFKTIMPANEPLDYCHGFVADLGESVDKQHGILTVRIANINMMLPGQIDRCAQIKPPLAASSNLFSDGALRLHGWAIDYRDEKRTLKIRAFIDHEQIAETVANLVHPTLRSADVGSHGFNLNLPLSLADGREHKVRVVDENGNPLNGSPITVCCYAKGGNALLPPDQTTLLTDVIEAYERHLPRSLSMEHYLQWSAMFETAEEQNKTAVNIASIAEARLEIGVIISGESDTALVERTCASLSQQTNVKLQIFTSPTQVDAINAFSAQLQQLIDSNCDIFTCIRAGDTLPDHAFSTALEGFNVEQAQLVYTDSESAACPWFKPAWNPEYALASDYPLELMLVRCSVLHTYLTNNPTPNSQASLSWNMLATLWPHGAQSIVHIPRVLYHFHTPISTLEQQARTEAAQQALRGLEPTSQLMIAPVNQAHALFQPRRLQRKLSTSDKNKKISLIIPTRDYVDMLKRCIDSIQHYTQWNNLEIIVVDNGSLEAKTKAYFKTIAKQGIRVLSIPGPFNFSALNNHAVDAASGEIIGLINNDIEATHAGWLDEIVSHLLSPGVGAVGAKLLWPNGMVQHGGVVLGTGNVAAHFGNRLSDGDWGDHGRNQLVQQVSAVTAACLFLRKQDYLEQGGMDPIAFPVAFNDLDLCLKIRAAGKSIIWTPYARLLHAESASRGHEDTPQKQARAQREVNQLRQRWGSTLLHDPAYHPSLNLDAHSHAFNGLALPPRNRAPRLAGLIKRAKA
jgi:GT2 family glycosyltransferase